MSSEEKRADEILALQSIFDKNFRLLDEDQYELSIDLDLIRPLTVECAHQQSTIEYLPPFTLLIHYHDEYPTDHPPSFILSCLYFSRSHLHELCQKLDNYPFVPGEVCVFDWVSLIKLEITDKLTLRDQAEEERDDDPRALNGYSNKTVEKVFEYLLYYNAEQFHHRIQACSICDNQTLGIDCIRLCRCRHFFCHSCLKNYVEIALNNGQFGEKVRCPQESCQQVILPTEIKQTLRDDQLYERYERLTLQQGLEAMDDIIWCPR